MKQVVQKVDYYDDLYKAYEEMNYFIKQGWRIHACTMETYTAGYSVYAKVLVVYEKEVEKNG